jgi:hypothetical protein
MVSVMAWTWCWCDECWVAMAGKGCSGVVARASTVQGGLAESSLVGTIDIEDSLGIATMPWQHTTTVSRKAVHRKWPRGVGARLIVPTRDDRHGNGLAAWQHFSHPASWLRDDARPDRLKTGDGY